MKHIIAIDDTGSPGNPLESGMLKNDRKTYVAVFIHSSVRQKLFQDINDLICEYKSREIIINEFHFTDIVNRRKEFKELKSEIVKDIFFDFTEILKQFRLPFFVQTVTPRSQEENGFKLEVNKSLDKISLDLLFPKIENFIRLNEIHDNFEIFIDDGLRKAGVRERVFKLDSLKNETYMTYDSSKDNLSLQIADYIAFGINKNQMMLIKEKRTDFDLFILKTVGEFFRLNPSEGMMPVNLQNNKFTSSQYDEIMLDAVKERGLFDNWKKVNK